MGDYTTAKLARADRGMLDFAIKLTRSQHEMTPADIVALRDVGFSDAAIHDVVQITGLFNYYTRVADGLGIDLEPEMSDPD
jgi:uncharacterized peroxidase-related enzyme